MKPLSGYVKPIESHQWEGDSSGLSVVPNVFPSSSQSVFQVLNVFPKMLPIARQLYPMVKHGRPTN
jgi:hypothetical protein